MSNDLKQNNMNSQELVFTNNVGAAIDAVVDRLKPNNIFVLVDTNTATFVLPRLQQQSRAVAEAKIITTKAGDIHKNLESTQAIWRYLGEEGATRHSLMINVGGGVVTDMGAFAAATFKRGIQFINVPTTLLGAVDASVGGKTGINFGNLKNEIGVFREADTVVLSTLYFNTLNTEELSSGYAEMLKHALLSDAASFDSLLSKHVEDFDSEELLQLLEASVLIKKKIVDADPTEKGLRKSLNLGHTAGHAFESLALERKSPIPHGYAVAYGLITELVLSHMKLQFPSAQLHRLAAYIKNVYGAFDFTCDDYPRLISLMRHDKKNLSVSEINFTLLREVGDVQIDCVIAEEDIKAALDITRDLLGI